MVTEELNSTAVEQASAPPELSIVIPTMNEELTIEPFLDWCWQGIRRAGATAEILIVDSSTDSTAEKAAAKGARVLKTPARGLGRAYKEGIKVIRGKYVLMGDADCTYDFRELCAFVTPLREGYEFVMGSRFRGHIEPGSMPWLHRYFGTPVTTWLLNEVFASRFSDIHCGMRAITADALVRMDLESDSWEYASEMVLKAVHMGLRATEVPVSFLKEPEGRLSHHRRSGWWSPWQAGWINLRVMFTHGAEFFTIRPGLAMTVCGLALALPLTFGPLRIGPFALSLNWMFGGLTLAVLGIQTVYLGCLSQMFHDYTGKARRRWLSVFRYNRSVLCSLALFGVGVAFLAPLITEYVSLGFTLAHSIGRPNHMAITGFLFVIIAFTNFVFTLVVQGAAAALRNPHVSDER